MAMLCGLAAFGVCGCSSPAPSIKVASETVEQARAGGFDYNANLAKAEHGDEGAIAALLRFSGQADAAGGLGHGVALVQLFALNGDAKMASVIGAQTDSVKLSVRRSLEAGEAYVSPQPDKPLRELYPTSFAALDG